jgi:protein TonB
VTAAAAKPATGSTTPANASPDAYAASAQRWRSRAGGGLGGGADAASGPIGAGGYGPGGGGQLVGLEFLAYRQKVIDSVKGNWVHVVTAPGLVARVRFEIAADGGVSDVQLEQSAGHAAYDASVLRAVQRVSPLPPPPARYASEFRVFVIEFHSEETTGQGSG